MVYAKTLIVDSNVELYDYSAGIWTDYGINSHRVDSIELALEEASIHKYHLIIIVECKEQRKFVLDSIKLFRELTYAPIVIASTDPIDPEYKITGFDMGADEVWEMPERIEVAVAKGNAIIRRHLRLIKEIDRQSTLIVKKHIVLSAEQRLVYVKGIKVELTKIEFDILALLITHPDKVLKYDYIYCEVWEDALTDTAKDTLQNQVYKLREKLKVDATIPNYIKTNHGIGYSFAPEYDKP